MTARRNGVQRSCRRWRIGATVGLWAVLASRSEAAPAPAPPAPAAPSAPTTGGDVAPQRVLVVVGAAGTPHYGRLFADWATAWRVAAERANAEFTLLGEPRPGPSESPESDDPKRSDHDQFQAWLADLAACPARQAWIVLLGHGTYDGAEAKFNLRGPDVSTAELARWLAPIDVPLAVVDCTAASGPLIAAASAPRRIIVTAAQSGDELNFARFGGYLADAIADPRGDLDKDDQTSLLEAFLTASRQVEEHYAGENRLASEHALLDDNGDRRGTPAKFFRGLRVATGAADGAVVDGAAARRFHLVESPRESLLAPAARRRRDQLEIALEALRRQKGKLPATEYYDRLEAIAQQLAEIYRDLPVVEPPTSRAARAKPD